MTVFSLVYTLHVLAALIWVGGMFFAWMILRPAAVAALEGPARLKLWANVFQRFFVWVWIAVAILPISGIRRAQFREFQRLDTDKQRRHHQIQAHHHLHITRRRLKPVEAQLQQANAAYRQNGHRHPHPYEKTLKHICP